MLLLGQSKKASLRPDADDTAARGSFWENLPSSRSKGPGAWVHWDGQGTECAGRWRLGGGRRTKIGV